VKAEDCKIGMEVIAYGHVADKGIITTLPNDKDKLTIKWVNSESLYKVLVADIEPYDPEAERKAITEIQAKLEVAAASFETAFHALQKAKDAMSRHQIWPNSSGGLIDASNLADVIGDNGWSSSSLWC
jgi:hypothetical protein